MGPKKAQDNKPSKKNQKAAVEKKLEDATFGMKNKNKSSKVQNFITQATKAAKNAPLFADGERNRQAKKDAAKAKLLQEEELRTLFNDAIGNQFGKSKAEKAADAGNLGINVQRKEVQDILDTISTDSESEEEDNDETERNMVFVNTGDDEEGTAVEAVEVFREKTIEDIIEEQRAKLLANGEPGTPVTNESFATWRAAKLAKRQEDAVARMKAEQTKKKGGKGLSVLSGKELFKYDSSLFVDDNAAITAKEEQDMTNERANTDASEEDKAKAEREKIMKDQELLMEVQRIEAEEEERRKVAWVAVCERNYVLGKERQEARAAAEAAGTVASLPKKDVRDTNNAFMFNLRGVTINGRVFAIEEEEMLDFFENDHDAELPMADDDDDEEEEEEEENNGASDGEDNEE